VGGGRVRHGDSIAQSEPASYRLIASRFWCAVGFGLRPNFTPFAFRRSETGELVPLEAEQEAVAEMIVLRREGRPLRAIAAAMVAKGHRISHEGVAGVLKAVGAT